MHVRRDDTVEVVSGKDLKKRGKVQQVLPRKGQVLVEGLNMVTKHQRPTGTIRQAGIIHKEMPMPVAKVMVVCPRCNRAVRVGHTFLDDGRKVRVCRRCKEMIDL